MKKLNKIIAVLMIVVFSVTTVTGCGLDGDPSNPDDKGLIETILDVITDDSTLGGSDSSDDGLSSIFSAIMGNDWFGWDDSSDNEGWGFSDGSGNSGNVAVSANYSDVNSVENGTGSTTLLVYMIGSNLESEGGCATADIMEMIDGNVSKDVNILIEAGGAKKWQNSVIKADELNTYRVEQGGLSTVRTMKKTSMVNPSTLTDFIKWGVSNYPADSYSLIFWNHGGGTLAGFGMDELFKGDLTVGDIASAIKASGAHFKFVGFDACLMGTIEVAYAMAPYADYLVASEEEEPGSGWYYTNFVKALTKNPSIDMKVLGQMIVDDFVAANNKRGDNVTLSVIDLSKIDSLFKSLVQLCASCDMELRNDNQKTISSARSKAKSFGSSDYDQIDIIDFCKRSGVNGSNEMINAVNDAVVYHKTNMANTNGLAMYFPYKLKSYYNQMASMMKGFGMSNPEYNGFFSDYLSVLQGHSLSKKSMSPMEATTGYKEEVQDYTSEAWYNEEIAQTGAGLDGLELNEDGELVAELMGDYYGISLSADEVDVISSIATVAYLDDGEGYIDLGMDDIYEAMDYDDGSADLYITFDNTWVALNGQVVPYYLSDTGSLANGQQYSEGFVAARLTDGITGEEKDIVIDIIWNLDTLEAKVIGYKDVVNEGEQAARKIFKFKNGDIIQALCDYYTYDGEYDDEYDFGDPIEVNGEITVSYEELGDCAVLAGLQIVDIYDQEYWTELISFE